ncbi:glycosyltransferase family 39 protein [Oharaeibacter diazotrophicus]|uniref:glycosyltransferase family 39 protein n=2 Tax=Oharaeibacter diazotrophicus TaxID=1920512 RepID=UPI001414E25D|nr:glycosyltransferase family 39 protein [Oharaeibacter diazotrophicus]GLS78691.1 hypothetical protein GCM10007904_40280 [Oharaeibacter diazotrophicus]
MNVAPDRPVTTPPQPAARGHGGPFGLLLLGYVVLWTLLPALAFRAVPLDVAENLLWGREWPLGTYKHPPLQAWLAWSADVALGHAGVYLLSALCLAATAVCVERFGRDLGDAGAGRRGALLLLCTWYATVPVPEFNANVVQMPIWAFAGLALRRALDRGGLGWWVALGLALAAALHAKYSVIFLVVGLAAALVVHPNGWRSLTRPGPWLAGVLAVAVSVPHLRWLVASDFQPLVYAAGRSETVAGAAVVLAPLKFLAAQALDLAPVAVLLAIAGVSRRERRPDAGLIALAFAPLAAMALYGLAMGVGLRDMWGAPAIVFVPLAAAAAATPPRRPGRLASAWMALTVAVPVVVAAISLFGPIAGLKPQKTAWPAAAIAAELDAAWVDALGADAVGGAPRIVAGNTWIAGLVVAEHDAGTSGFVDADYARNPWITPERVERDGVLFVRTDDGEAPPSWWGPFAATGTIEVPFSPGDGRSVRLAYAIRAPGTPAPVIPEGSPVTP